YYAKKAVWFAKFRVPLELRKPRQRQVWLVVISTVTLGLGTALFLAVLAYLVTASHIKEGKAESVAIIMSLTVLFLLMLILTSSAIIRRLVNATTSYFRYRQWPGWHSIFVDPPKHYHDIGLPPDDFVGFEIPALLRIVALAIDL